jgi:hypothetical protein
LLYLDLLKRALVRWGEDEIVERPVEPPEAEAKRQTRDHLARLGWQVTRRIPFDAAARETGQDWPSQAETMIGMKRLDNLQHCIQAVIADEVPGDLIETGVWRGGSSIFMRACLAAFGDGSRAVWCADSFQGLPPPNPEKYPQDRHGDWHTHNELAIPLEQVQANFRKYGLLDDRVKFLVGWFSETLPTAPIDRLAILRLDGDMYESTMDGLNALYDKLSPGGFVIVDDYGLPAPQDMCRVAVHDFRKTRGIEDEIVEIDQFGVYWRRT